MKKIIAELKKQNEELRSELNFYREKYQRAEQAYNQLLFYFKQFQRHRFGCKSERFKDGDLAQQGDLFGEFITDEFAQEEDDEDEDSKVISIVAHKRRKKKANNFPADLPRKEVIIKAKDRICSCGKEKVFMRYETTELLNHIPEIFEVIEQKREVLVCPDGCDGSIAIAENPPKVLPKIKVTESVLSHIIVSKLHDRQPLYHLEKKFSDRFGIDISRNNLARWFIETAQALQPLINLMKDEVIDYDVSSCDATSIQVLAEPGRAATKKSYWYCIRGGPPNKKCILYDYNATEHKLFLVNWFEGFKGYIHVDAQNILAL
jgi:transposase